jgi:hypothetical protein
VADAGTGHFEADVECDPAILVRDAIRATRTTYQPVTSAILEAQALRGRPHPGQLHNPELIMERLSFGHSFQLPNRNSAPPLVRHVTCSVGNGAVR